MVKCAGCMDKQSENFLLQSKKLKPHFSHMTTRAGKLTLFLCSQQNLNTNLTPLPIKEGARI